MNPRPVGLECVGGGPYDGDWFMLVSGQQSFEVFEAGALAPVASPTVPAPVLLGTYRLGARFARVVLLWEPAE